MHFTFSIYFLPLIIAVIFSFIITRYSWQYRQFPIGKAMFVLSLTTSWWAFWNILEYGFNSLAVKQICSNFQYFGIETVPVLWLIVIVLFLEHNEWLTKRNVLIISIIPIITIILMQTNSYHGLMRTNMHLDTNGSFSIIKKDYGPWFWVAATYNYMLMLFSSFLLIFKMIKTPKTECRPLMLLLLIALFPLLGNVIFVFKLFPWMRIDLSATLLSVSGILMSFGIERFQLMGVVPIARKHVINNLADPIIIVDGMNRIMDYNRSCQRLFNLNKNQLTRSLEEILQPLHEQLPELNGEKDFRREVTVDITGEELIFDLRVNSLYNKKGKFRGKIFHFNDVSERKRTELEREKIIKELQDALKKVDTLSGFLPICSNCKKIRDDEGYWNEVELYISKHSNIQFSHGLCTECMKKLHPNEYKRLKEKGRI